MVTCEQEPEPLTVDSVIYGNVQLYWPSQGERTNIKVTVFGPYGQQFTTVDEIGNFTFTGMGNGTYSLEYAQEGYGTIRQYGIQLFGNDTVQTGSVYLFKKVGTFKMPDFINAYFAEHNQSTYLWIETDLSMDDHAMGIPAMLFFSKESDVSFEKYEFSFPAWDNWFNDVEVPTIFVNPYILPFESGEKVYITGYVCNYYEYSFNYLDTYLGRRIYSTLDPSRHSNVISITIP